MKRPAVQILIVDDEATIRFTLSHLLQRRDYAVMTATDGNEALTLIRARSFDLLLLDLMLPGMNGVALARQARALQPAAAILILTGSQDFGKELDDVERYGFDWMYKTSSPQEVLDRVATLTT